MTLSFLLDIIPKEDEHSVEGLPRLLQEGVSVADELQAGKVKKPFSGNSRKPQLEVKGRF